MRLPVVNEGFTVANQRGGRSVLTPLPIGRVKCLRGGVRFVALLATYLVLPARHELTSDGSIPIVEELRNLKRR